MACQSQTRATWHTNESHYLPPNVFNIEQNNAFLNILELIIEVNMSVKEKMRIMSYSMLK